LSSSTTGYFASFAASSGLSDFRTNFNYTPMKIFVANLPYHVTSEGITQLFGLFGAVMSSKIVTENGKSKGFGFLEMEDDEQAQKAIKTLDGSPIADRNIVVKPAETQEETSTAPTSSMHKKLHKRPRTFQSLWRKQ